MGNYRNFKLAVYFIADGTASAARGQLQNDIDFFQKHLHLDKVYLEPFRGGTFASEEQTRMCLEVFQDNGIAVSGGITATLPPAEAGEFKQRLFNTFCYTDEIMLKKLAEVSTFLGKMFDEFIIDDFFFSNCTCTSCRAAQDAYNRENNITDGSWERFRMHLMGEVSKNYMIAPAKAANPKVRIIIKYPNWMESYQETGYDPENQVRLFDAVYTGTETRDPVHTDQHLPRYLSFSLMRYMEAVWPGHNGGGWFDPYDCGILEHYLEQAYLTAFSKPREITLFCFQSLSDTVNIPALGFQLDKLDRIMTHTGNVSGLPCYIPHHSQGEDNVQDFLGMHGIPVVTTPDFPHTAGTILLTASSACDPDIIEKTEKFVAAGGKAVVTSGFVSLTLERGLKRMTSIRCRGRKTTVRDYMTESLPPSVKMSYPHGTEPVEIPVLEFRNNATWSLCKGIHGEESYLLLARDTYGKGQLITLTVPDAFPDFARLPVPVLSRIRRELAVNGVYIEGAPMISLFLYDNDTFILYAYAGCAAQNETVFLHMQDGAVRIRDVITNNAIEPLYTCGGETIFPVNTEAGKFRCWHIER